jgi:hypothetical protein
MLDDSYIMPFGKHKGTQLYAVPVSYWKWLLEQDGFRAERHNDLREYASYAVHVRSASYEDAVRQFCAEPEQSSEPFHTRLDLRKPKDDGISDPFANA